jgi:tetratricopeptide (TPR) repeat protein
MKQAVLILIVCLSGLLPVVQGQETATTQAASGKEPPAFLLGEWVRMGHSGPVGLRFSDDGQARVDLGMDGVFEVVSGYHTDGTTIRFNDLEGLECPGMGVYHMHQGEFYLALDLVRDDCAGRIQTTMGYWIRPGFREYLPLLNERIARDSCPEDILGRGRIFLALGESERARADLDIYLSMDGTNARALLNRAATRFPGDLEGAVGDCSRVIELEPENKNAWFLRGLALYELGRQEEGCRDFSRAIDLGFSILKEAEYEKCRTYWHDNHQ